MAARAIWKGVISFGMVSIPVQLYTATENKDISFHLLHKDCNSRVKQIRWCPTEDREIEWGETVRGYEYAKGRHVILTDEDFERLPLASKHTIELTAFVNAAEIDPVFYEKSYYLEPEDLGVKPYALLIRALQSKGLTALAKLAIRNKERLCALRPVDGTLMLETLFYPDEIRVERGKELDVEVSDRELAMALTLIDLLSETFDPLKYRDEYRDALMEIIESKLQGVEMAQEQEPVPTNITDLMAALRASVEAAQRGKEASPEIERAAG